MDLLRPLILRHEDRFLEAARSGDRQAFVRLYRSLHAPVWRFVARRCAEAADAEDLVARVFTTLLERMDQVDLRRGHVRTYLLSTARNALIDHARTARPLVGLDAAEPLLVEPSTPLEALLEDEARRDLRARVAELPVEARLLVGLRYADGLSAREIAGLLGLTPAAARQRLSRAVRSLRAPPQPQEGHLAHEP